MTSLIRARGLSFELRADEADAVIDGRRADLSRREYQVLSVLAEAANEVIPRELIYERVWQRPARRKGRSVDEVVATLRIKIEQVAPQWEFIHTRWGIGYWFAPQRRGTAARAVHRGT